jgi:GNAT superfamily N-acetyltransferase
VATLRSLYARETDHWQSALCWDTQPTWTTIETARTTWGLPGYICRDHAGRIQGWSYFMMQEHTLDVGGIISDSQPATATLVNALLDRAGKSTALHGLIYERACGLRDVLVEQRVPHTPYAYSLRASAPSQPNEHRLARLARVLSGRTWTVRAWEAGDTDLVARLLQQAYGDSGRLLVRSNTEANWTQYASALTTYDGCGAFSPALTRVLVVDDRVAAVAMMSVIAAETAHLTQLAVMPEWKGRGLGRALLDAALCAADAAGFRATSLLVASDNASARHLYREAGFVDRARFIAFVPPATTLSC